MGKADMARLGAGERAVWVVKGLPVPLWPPRVPQVGCWRLTVAVVFGYEL
jgi:hypothetical protein